MKYIPKDKAWGGGEGGLRHPASFTCAAGPDWGHRGSWNGDDPGQWLIHNSDSFVLDGKENTFVDIIVYIDKILIKRIDKTL